MSEQTGRYTLVKPILKRFRPAGGGASDEREEQITEVLVREPLAGDLRVMDSATGQVGGSIALLAKLTGLDVRDIDKLGMADFVALSKIVEGFTPPGLLTGATA